MEIKNLAFAAVIIMCLAIAYYFVIELPNQNKAKLDLEKQKIEREQQEKSNRETKLINCRAQVESYRNDYLRLNGTPVPGEPGVYRGVNTEQLHRIEKDGNDECIRLYGEHH
jgi:hypothetical protein